MKKIFILIVCMLFVIPLVACQKVPNTQYWLDAQGQLSEIYNSEEYSSLKNITFSNNVQNLAMALSGQGENELQDIYINTLNSCLGFTLSNYNILLVVPNNNNVSFYNHLNSLISDSTKFKDEIDAFNQSKSTFESKIDVRAQVVGAGNLIQDSIAINELLQFKREFLTLIEKAYSLAENFNKVYNYGYINLDNVKLDEKNIDMSYSLYKTLSVENCNLKTLKSLIAVLKEYDCRSEIIAFKELFNTQKDYYNKIKQGIDTSDKTDDYTNCNKWLLIYNNYKNELKKFNKVINKIDFVSLSRDYEDNLEEYAEDRNDSSIILQYDYAINFYKMNQQLISSTYNFCNIK